MNNRIILLAFTVLIFANCSPKTTSTISQKQEAQDVEIVDHTFRKTAPTPGPAPKINIGKAETFKLDNELQVIVVENHKIPQVSFQITLKNDPLLEGDQVGYISMAGDMLGRGTTSRTKAEIDESVDFIGANLSTFSTGMFGSSLTKHTGELLNILTDVLYNPAFLPEELDKIKKQTLSGLESNKTDPNAIASNLRAVILYGKDHPYGEVQTVDNVENITLDKCMEYYDKYFIPNNAYLIIVGDVTLEKAKAIAEKYFGKWERKPIKLVTNREVSKPTSRNVFFANKDGAVQSVINVAYPVQLKPGTEDVIKASVMNTILGGGFSSRLMQNLREDKAYTYGSRSSLSSDPLVGSFNASASVRNEVTDSSITEILYELQKIRTEQVDSSELQSRKNYMTGSFARSLESPQTIARFALNTFRYQLADDYYESYLEKLNKVSPADVLDMAQKYILPEMADILVVGNKDDVAEKLLVFDDDGEIDYFDAFGHKIEIDDIPLPENLTGLDIISDYIRALGSREKIEGISTLYSKMTSEMMGQTFNIESYYDLPVKFAMIVGNGSTVFQESVFDGEKGMVSTMGQKQMVTDGPQLARLKAQAVLFPQLTYSEEGYELELKGVENVDGIKCYKIAIINPSGDRSSEYFDISSSLLIRSVKSQEGQRGTITITSDYDDYQSVEGILFPYLIKISGVMPMVMEAKVEEIKINPDLPEDQFKVE